MQVPGPYCSGNDINFTCGFEEEDFNELPDEVTGQVNHLVNPQRELRVHSNNLKHVSLKSHGVGLHGSSQWSFTPNMMRNAGGDGGLEGGCKSVKKMNTANVASGVLEELAHEVNSEEDGEEDEEEEDEQAGSSSS